MNTRENTRERIDRDGIDGIDFSDPRVQREWRAQERAAREEALGLPMARGFDDDARVGEYRLLARALRHPPLDPVPEAFAAQVARWAESDAGSDERVERWLLRALVALFGAAAIAVVARYGSDWWPSAEGLAAVPAMAGGAGVWASALLACLALSWLLQELVRQLADGGGHTA